MSLEPPNIRTEGGVSSSTHRQITTTILSQASISLSFALFTYIYLLLVVFTHPTRTLHIREIATPCCLFLWFTRRLPANTTSPEIVQEKGIAIGTEHIRQADRHITRHLGLCWIHIKYKAPRLALIIGLHHLQQVNGTYCWPSEYGARIAPSAIRI
ncbi:hypothetical protein F5Y14DRAFT_254228 [Nemania sp. NC0429]|nr:hypothetical protein F5Y14DRAFT_254228 [Nemania sp. NC0429]